MRRRLPATTMVTLVLGVFTPGCGAEHGVVWRRRFTGRRLRFCWQNVCLQRSFIRTTGGGVNGKRCGRAARRVSAPAQALLFCCGVWYKTAAAAGCRAFSPAFSLPSFILQPAASKQAAAFFPSIHSILFSWTLGICTTFCCRPWQACRVLTPGGRISFCGDLLCLLVPEDAWAGQQSDGELCWAAFSAVLSPVGTPGRFHKRMGGPWRASPGRGLHRDGYTQLRLLATAACGAAMHAMAR